MLDNIKSKKQYLYEFKRKRKKIYLYEVKKRLVDLKHTNRDNMRLIKK